MKLLSFLKEQEHPFIDPVNLGLLYIKSGVFTIKMRKMIIDPDDDEEPEEKEMLFMDKEFIDGEQLISQYQMILVSMVCESGTGTLLSLSNFEYKTLLNNQETLAKDVLHPKIL